MDRESVVAGVLASPAGVRAVLEGDAGALIRLVRQAHGWRQADLGRRTGYSQPTISRLERGRGRITDVIVLRHLGQALGVPQAALGLAGEFGPGQVLESGRSLAGVRRSEFLRATLGAAIALALPRAVTDDAEKVDEETVRECRAALGRLYDLDQQLGGEQVYPIAAHMVDRMRRTLHRASYSPAVGRALHEVAATTSEHAAWLAFDAGREDDARRWWLESLHLADLGDAREARVIALTTMALSGCDSDDPARGREAVGLVDAARRSVGTAASPRLLSLLAAREARGYARAGDRPAAIRALGTAASLLDRDPYGGDSEAPWLRFYDPSDLFAHEGRVALMLGDLGRAETAERSALEQTDQTRYPRNHTISAARLGSVLVRNGKLDEGIAVSRPVVLRARTLGSRRLERDILGTLKHLDQRRDYPPAQTFVDWSRRMLRAA